MFLLLSLEEVLPSFMFYGSLFTLFLSKLITFILLDFLVYLFNSLSISSTPNLRYYKSSTVKKYKIISSLVTVIYRSG